MKIMRIQNWLKSRTHRAAVSLAAALAAALIWNPTAQSGSPAMCWWGMLYPRFCIVGTENEDAPDEAERDMDEAEKVSDEAERASDEEEKASDNAERASNEEEKASDETENAFGKRENTVRIKPAFWLAEKLAKLLG